MEVADTFIPTAGAVGLLSMVTYFFLVVAMFAFLGSFIFTVATRTPTFPDRVRSAYPLSSILLIIGAAIAGLTYYLIQSYYHNVLAEMATISDPNDRRTLIRESYNAIGQYRYIAWFIITPLLLFQLMSMLNVQLSDIKRQAIGLLAATVFMVFTSYIGHQQLSFDNEIQVGPKLVWGLIALINYVSIVFTFNRLWKGFGGIIHADFRLAALTMGAVWGIYFIGYFLTLVDIDFNWIHLVFTIADVVSIIGVGIVAYMAHLKTVEQ